MHHEDNTIGEESEPWPKLTTIDLGTSRRERGGKKKKNDRKPRCKTSHGRRIYADEEWNVLHMKAYVTVAGRRGRKKGGGRDLGKI